MWSFLIITRWGGDAPSWVIVNKRSACYRLKNNLHISRSIFKTVYWMNWVQKLPYNIIFEGLLSHWVINACGGGRREALRIHETEYSGSKWELVHNIKCSPCGVWTYNIQRSIKWRSDHLTSYAIGAVVLSR